MPKPTLKDLQQQVAELTEALMRERADATNLRRRHDEQIASLKNMLKTGVVEELLPVIDNFERAVKHVPKELEENDYIKGIRGVVKQFENTLSQMGVQRIKTVGEHFDPNLHEAVGIEDSEGEVEVICEELQPGYQINGQVVRHAMVKVKKEAK